MRSIQLLLTLSVILYSCGSTPAKKEYFLTIKGSESMHDTFSALKSDFEQIQDTLKINIEGGGSRTGMMAIANDEADIGLSSFPFNLDSILGNEHGINEEVVAFDGIVIIHNEANPIEELTNEQISDIYSGRLTDWSQLGGNAGRILPVIRDENSGTQQFFVSYFDLDSVSPLAQVSRNNNEIISNVFDNQNSIGFIGYAYFSVSTKEIAVPAKGDTAFIHPSTRNLVSGRYPLKRSLRIYFKEENDPAVTAFLSYLRSRRAKSVIEGFGLVTSS